MELYCRKCTRAEDIKGDMEAALAKGWQLDRWESGDLFLCPKCNPNFRYTAKTDKEKYLEARDIISRLSRTKDAPTVAQ